jgi:acetolactate synthase-1/2/3 large subunit
MHAERVRNASEFEAALRDALARESGTLLQITLSPEVISTRTTLRQITEQALRLSSQRSD